MSTCAIIATTVFHLNFPETNESLEYKTKLLQRFAVLVTYLAT